MIVQCDKCNAKFQLADDKIPDKGAKVRCSKCKSVFEVKKDSGVAPDVAETAAAPASGAPPARPKAPAGGEDDPFSDFNFSDDMDFGDEGGEDFTVEAPPKAKKPSGGAPPPPVETGPKFDSESEPGPPSGGGEDFDFSDDDFSFADEPKDDGASAPPDDDFGSFDFADEGPADAEPAPQKAAPPPAAKPPVPGKGPAGDDFEDFQFNDEGFDEADAEAPSAGVGAAPSPPGDDEWGNVSFDGGAESAPSGGGDDEDFVEEAGFGDFQFDSGDEEEDGSIDISEDFVRGPSGPVRDDLEANLGDTDNVPEPPPAGEEADAPPPPPKPSAKSDSSGGGGGLVKIILAVLVIAGLGAGGYLYKDKILEIIQGPPELPPGEVKIVGEPTSKVVKREDGSILVFEGTVKNETDRKQSGVMVEMSLSDLQGNVVAVGRSYWGVTFTDEELMGELPREQIEDHMLTASGRLLNDDFRGLAVPPGQTREYTIIFFDLQGKVRPGKPRIVDPEKVDVNSPTPSPPMENDGDTAGGGG